VARRQLWHGDSSRRDTSTRQDPYAEGNDRRTAGTAVPGIAHDR